MSDTTAAEDLLDEIGDLAEQERHVSLGDLVERIGHRGFGPLLFVPALVVVSPLGGIPGVPTLFAVVIALIAVQVLLGRSGIWMPHVLETRNINAERVGQAVKTARPYAKRVDRWLGNGLSTLVQRPAKLAAAAAVLGLCVMVPPLEILPFAAAVPMLAIALIGLAFTARDGVLMLAGLCVAGAALIWGAFMLISG
ncbi:MAG: exopolysaccharide biosynthesis protein [Roseovarius sp.]